MRLLIPTLGTVLTLDEDWTFDLYQERRNEKFARQPGLDFDWPRWCHPWEWVDLPGGKRERRAIPPTPVTLPKGTILKVDRIYIRSKAADFRNFDSITFFCNPGVSAAKAKKQGLLRGRFWAKLLDVNAAEVLIDPTSMPMPEFRD